MPQMEYMLEDMGGNWIVNMWHKDLAIIDKKVFVTSQDDVNYLRDQGFRVVEETNSLPKEVNASVVEEEVVEVTAEDVASEVGEAPVAENQEPVVSKKGTKVKNESIKAATLIEQ